MSNTDLGSLSTAELQKLSSLKIYQGEPGRPYTVLQAVKGLSCHRNGYHDTLLTDSEAMQGVKIKAAQLGADAVVNANCQVHSDTDWVNNCWASVVCVGVAAKLN